MLSEPKGRKLGTLLCKGLKPPVVRGHAAAWRYWLDAFGHCGPYKETIVNQEDGSRKLVAEGNPMNAPGITNSIIYYSLHNYGKHRINYPKIITF